MTPNPLFQRNWKTALAKTVSSVIGALIAYVLTEFTITLLRIDRYSRRSTDARAKAMRDLDQRSPSGG
jgi:membrane protein YqaA with SNARE-associated domain